MYLWFPTLVARQQDDDVTLDHVHDVKPFLPCVILLVHTEESVQSLDSCVTSLRSHGEASGLMCAFLYRLCEAVGDGERGVDETLHTAHETGLGTRVQL